MKEQPCNVCGSTDLNLIDGYYYCVECGTQDVNVRETVVEQTYLADGTIAFLSGKRFATIVKDGIEMSGEWYKWHAYNFILAGLTEELIELGAKPTVKLKVLWIWTRYIKTFQVKEELIDKSKFGESHLSFSKIPQTPTDSDNSESEDDFVVKKKRQLGQFHKDVKIFTKGLLLAILYLALNFDQSHIQLSHLLRFIKEGRLSLLNCTKYIPKEINTKVIPHWKSFLLCQSEYNSHTIRAYAMTCIKTLDLGFPIVPDFNKIVDSFIKELCLPNDFKDLVLSLMLYHPFKNVDVNKTSVHTLVRLPDYENIAMTYVLVALKMCFGLDGEYEIKLSDVIAGINSRENHFKSHKIGMCSEPSDRLFSFNEWTRFLQFRKTILCQYYLPIARQHNYDVDDYVLMEQLEKRGVRPLKLRDEVTMDILNKIPYEKNIDLIPKSEFVSCLTPLSNYTEVIINYVLDKEIRLLLSEDFTQYALKYASKLLILDDMKDAKNSMAGISEENKIIKASIVGNFRVNEGDGSMVFIRNCENKNWLKTNPPTVAHITKINEDECNGKDSYQGDDSTIENTLSSNDEDINDNEEVKLEFIKEENKSLNIFDDNFDNYDDKSYLESVHNNTGLNECNNEHFNDNYSEYDDTDELKEFDPNNFDRTKLIDELIAMACVKYKIPMPRQYVPKQQRKRENKTVSAEAGESAPKRSRRNIACGKQMQCNDMVAAYYTHVENDILTKLTEQFRNAINTQNSHCEDVNNYSVQSIPGNEGTYNDVNPESNMNLEQSDHKHSIINRSLCSNDVDNAIHGTHTHTLNESDGDENENEDLDSRVQVEDPNFDSKTHNTKQLYVKINAEFGFNDFIEINDDPELDQIIIDKIEEACDDDNTKYKESFEDVTKCEVFYYSDSDEDEFFIEEQKKLFQEREKMIKGFEPLVKKSLKIKEFKYWLRHYGGIKKNLDMHQQFDSELNDNYPASFNFVIRECAAILNSSTFSLYKCMQKLEEEIIKKSTLRTL